MKQPTALFLRLSILTKVICASLKALPRKRGADGCRVAVPSHKARNELVGSGRG